ncbi:MULTISPECIES: hypothetical protein [Ralstonia solanacearum species complex]|uniref:hypothetical protein n=1 Tax=Ralstonia solanacearum species complex TaxID=3116862 RepID=UPI0005C78B4F|nr:MULTISPECIES: hypothetical protein [Ralstonia solanacearum species complex]ARS54937.1 hypothetical protein BC427_01710 [Ralstonia solanacearum FJAT-91]AMP38718.1 hypothetical protein LBM2029_14755 [Ralstonia solanacearum]AOE88467.1 hypothetical protein LBM341_00149 [Ralstonia solanacearum]AXV70573.1 hypothetical protein CJO74_15510 [Ralstonia solanacearum]AXV87544.1 hypothetical protein CJO78_15170 [Ralstonia solanacearum]
MSSYDKLDAAMDAFDKRKAEEKEEAADKQIAVEKFRTDFAAFRMKTAHPVFEDIGAHLQKRGHGFKVEMTALSTTLHVFPAGREAQEYDSGHANQYPKITLIGDALDQKVHVHMVVSNRSGMASTSEITLDLSDLTANSLRDLIVECLAKSFAG